MIERVTGERPPTCPWRAMSHPLVREVMALSWAVDDGNLAAVMEPDPPGILVEGLAVYRRALRAVRNEDEKIRLQEAERKRKR